MEAQDRENPRLQTGVVGSVEEEAHDETTADAAADAESEAGERPAEPTPGDRIVAEIGRLAELRDAGALSDAALEAATAQGEGKVAFTPDGHGGFVLDFGMMPDPPRRRRSE